MNSLFKIKSLCFAELLNGRLFNYCLMVFWRIIFVMMLAGYLPVRGQQTSFTSGSDFYSAQHQVHVSLGQIFGTFQVKSPLLETGVLSVLSELMILEKSTELANSIRISPNPFLDELTIESELILPLGGQLDLYTNQGILVESRRLNTTKLSMALGHLDSGVYLIRVQVFGKLDFVQKIIKMN